MAAQIALVRGGWPAISQALEEVRLDPAFAGFASWCRESRIPLRVVSEGIEQVITFLFRREGVPINEVWAMRLVARPDGGLALRFPPADKALCDAGLCKCALFTTAEPRPLRVLIGDGRSDFCSSRRADLVFACSNLAIHCSQNDIPFLPFTGFVDVRRFLEDRGAVPPRAPETARTIA